MNCKRENGTKELQISHRNLRNAILRAGQLTCQTNDGARKVATHWLLGYVKRKVPFHQEPPQHSKRFTEFKVLLSSDFSDLMEISMDFKFLHHQWVLNNLRPHSPNSGLSQIWLKWCVYMSGQNGSAGYWVPKIYAQSKTEN